MTTPKCPDCETPLWLAACKCGWQREPRTDRRSRTRDAFEYQRAMYTYHVDEALGGQ